jgi:uncharacterized protein YciI
MKFDRFTIVLLVLRADAPQLDDEAAHALQDAHLAHLASLHEAGHLIAAGPFTAGDPGESLRGLCIFGIDAEQTRRLTEQDPAVRAGRFSCTVLPWMVPAGAIAFSPTTFPRSIAET